MQREIPIYDIIDKRSEMKRKKPPALKELLGETKYFLKIALQNGYELYDLDMIELEEINAYNMALNYYEE